MKIEVPPALLEMSQVSKSFDGRMALLDASISVNPGEVHALLGENGAGKSTLMTIACGIYQPDGGQVLVDGVPTSIDGPAAARALGIGMVHQHFKLVPQFTVAENILLACDAQVALEGKKALIKRSRRIAAELEWRIDFDLRIAALSVAAQQRIEIVKVLTQGARILILDEPTAVLAEAEGELLLRKVKELAARGVAVVIITHRLKDVVAFADRVTVMRNGATLMSQSAAGIMVDQLTRIMVGETPVLERRPSAVRGRVLLAVNDLCTAGVNEIGLVGVQMRVRSGEIYGIAGVGGNGQRELVEAICGVRALRSGQILLDAVRIDRRSPRQRRMDGLRAIPADRYADALCGELSVADNHALTRYRTDLFGGILKIDRKALTIAVSNSIQQFEIHGAQAGTRTRLLSGGNAQKLLLGRELEDNPKVIVAHSPTRGLDVCARAAVHSQLLRVRDAGSAVVLLSEDLDEVLLLSDVVGVLNRGKIVGELSGTLDREQIGNLMLAH